MRFSRFLSITMYLNNDHTSISAYFKFLFFFYIEVPAMHNPIEGILSKHFFVQKKVLKF